MKKPKLPLMHSTNHSFVVLRFLLRPPTVKCDRSQAWVTEDNASDVANPVIGQRNAQELMEGRVAVVVVEDMDVGVDMEVEIPMAVVVMEGDTEDTREEVATGIE